MGDRVDVAAADRSAKLPDLDARAGKEGPIRNATQDQNRTSFFLLWAYSAAVRSQQRYRCETWHARYRSFWEVAANMYLVPGVNGYLMPVTLMEWAAQDRARMRDPDRVHC